MRVRSSPAYAYLPAPWTDRFRWTLDVSEHDLQNIGRASESVEAGARLFDLDLVTGKATEDHFAAPRELDRSRAEGLGVEARMEIADLARADLDAVVGKLRAETESSSVALVEPDPDDGGAPPLGAAAVHGRGGA